MKTYMIQVNGKYMVKANLETESLAGAEHFILDNFDGIEAALAFDEKQIRTLWFVQTYLAGAEVISLDELRRKSDNFTAAYAEYSVAKNALDSKDDEIEALKQKLAELQAERTEMKKVELSKWLNVRNANNAINFGVVQ